MRGPVSTFWILESSESRRTFEARSRFSWKSSEEGGRYTDMGYGLELCIQAGDTALISAMVVRTLMQA